MVTLERSREYTKKSYLKNPKDIEGIMTNGKLIILSRTQKSIETGKTQIAKKFELKLWLNGTFL